MYGYSPLVITSLHLRNIRSRLMFLGPQHLLSFCDGRHFSLGFSNLTKSPDWVRYLTLDTSVQIKKTSANFTNNLKVENLFYCSLRVTRYKSIIMYEILLDEFLIRLKVTNIAVPSTRDKYMRLKVVENGGD